MKLNSQLVASWLERNSVLVFLFLVLIGSLRIVSTYTVFSHTSDEPAHIATGMEWLDRGQFQYEPLHPPLARVAAALGPFLDGRTSQGQPDMWQEGLAILGKGEQYDRTLALARLGILPFFWIACAVVYCWGRRYFGKPVAALAVLIFSMLPPVLAHAGLATTDMALTALVGAAFLAAVTWCEQPDLPRVLCLGVISGLAVLAKFSAMAFLPVSLLASGLVYVLIERPAATVLAAQLLARLPGVALAAVTALLVIWAGYRFSFGAVPFTSLPLPFPELFAGVKQLVDHNRVGAPAYLLGQHNAQGWWYYYFVVLAVKTPLSVLLLIAVGMFPALGFRCRGWWLAPVFSFSILVFCLSSHINLGVRHILPVYLGFSMIAAQAASSLLEIGCRHRAARWLAVGLLLELVVSSALAHPDYLAYFNPLVGAHPERILVDSDLDWGQDFKRLAARLQKLGAQNLTFTPCMTTNPAAIGLPPLTPNDFLHPAPGWNAVRITQLELFAADVRVSHPGLRLWPDVIPPGERVGKGLLLWYFPESLPLAPAGLPVAHVYCQ